MNLPSLPDHAYQKIDESTSASAKHLSQLIERYTEWRPASSSCDTVRYRIVKWPGEGVERLMAAFQAYGQGWLKAIALAYSENHAIHDKAEFDEAIREKLERHIRNEWLSPNEWHWPGWCKVFLDAAVAVSDSCTPAVATDAAPEVGNNVVPMAYTAAVDPANEQPTGRATVATETAASDGIDPVAAERAALLDNYKTRARGQGIKLTDAMVAHAASQKWNDRTYVGWWKRNDYRSKPPHDKKIRTVLAQDPRSLWKPNISRA
jgi:hypothetical protein